MTTEVVALKNAPQGELDSVWHEGRFQLVRVDAGKYHLYAIGNTRREFCVEVVDGGCNARVSALSLGLTNGSDCIEYLKFEEQWPHGIANLETRRGGFHLERMTAEWWMLVTADGSVDFKITSGPKRSRLALRETTSA